MLECRSQITAGTHIYERYFNPFDHTRCIATKLSMYFLTTALYMKRYIQCTTNTVNRAVSSTKQPSKETLCLLVEGTTNSAVICLFVQNSPKM